IIYKPKTERKTVVKNDNFIERILENLDQVKESDWEMYCNLDSVYPTNLFTKKKYSGFNVIALFLDTMIKKCNTARYATFNSISKAGGKLKKGAKGCVIEFFSFVYKHKETGKIYRQEQVREMTPEQQKQINKLPCLKNYVVFNSELIENLQEINLNILEDEPIDNDFLEMENCESFISNIISKGLDLRFAVKDVAFYSPSLDYVQLPKKDFFISTAKYYSTLFHEVIHWTGHPERLNREMKGHNDQESYSFEELIAEMGAMLCSLQFGIMEEFINSVRYLKGWATRNSQDRETAIRKAFIESKRAKKYLENITAII
ncbi:TPA: zincin-like metallopeptidase domain-containing protein, partial [Elizabethkingia anophelis]